MPGTCDSRPTSSPAAATWNGRRDISKHHAVRPRVVGSWRVLSTWRATRRTLREADEEIDVLGARLFLDDVLQQEVARAGIEAVAVDGRAPAGELRDVLVVLRRPRAELVA